MTLNLSKNVIIKLLSILAALLVFLHVAGVLLSHQFEHRLLDVLVEKFSLEGEGNFPAYFSSLLLLLAAGLFGVIGYSTLNETSHYSKYWFGLAGIFVFLSLDEAVQIHEKLDSDLIWGSLQTTGLLAWPWVTLYAGLVVIIGLFYFKFWRSFTPGFQRAFALAAVLYVGSALGFEMLEALEFSTKGEVTNLYILLISLEESLEMIAIIYLISINLRYLLEDSPDLHIQFSS